MFKRLALTLLLLAAGVLCYATTEVITDKGMSQKGLYTLLANLIKEQNTIVARHGNLSYSSGLIVVASQPLYMVSGVWVEGLATNTQAFSSGHTNTTASQSCYFAVCGDASGNYSTVQGAIASTNSATWPALLYPVIPSTKACLGLIRVRGAFQVATSTLATSTITNGKPPLSFTVSY